MVPFLLPIFLSGIASIGGPTICLIAAGLLLWRGWVRTAIVVAMIAGGWFVSGLIYQEGIAACQAKVDLAVQAEKDRQGAANTAALESARKQAAVTEAENNELEKKVTEYETELAKRADSDQCLLDPDDAERLQRIR